MRNKKTPTYNCALFRSSLTWSVLRCLVLSFFIYLQSHLIAAPLDYKTISYPKSEFFLKEMGGFKFYLHENISKRNHDDILLVLETYKNAFLKLAKLVPETASQFNEYGYKVILLEEECDGLEVIKTGQSKWDQRHGVFAEKSIIVCKALSYAKEAQTDKYSLFPYLVHEMMHVHHMEILGLEYNWLIKKSFDRSRRIKAYNQDDYIFHSFSEYWAEISTAYLLIDGYDPSFVRPANSKWLFENDKGSYELCLKLLGPKKAGFKSIEGKKYTERELSGGRIDSNHSGLIDKRGGRTLPFIPATILNNTDFSIPSKKQIDLSTSSLYPYIKYLGLE